MSETSFAQNLFTSVKSRFLTPGKQYDRDIGRLPFSAEHMSRRSAYAERWAYYRGFQSQPLRVREGQKDTNVIENFSRKIVNDTVGFLFGAGDLSFQVGTDDMDDDPAEFMLSDFWEPVHWNPALFLEKVGQSGAITGTPFVRLYTNDDREPRIRFTVLDSSLVDVITADDNIDEVVEYWSYWRSTTDNLWHRHRIARTDAGLWEIVEEVYKGAAWDFDETAVLPWPYEWAPIFHCQNLPLAHSFWGLSDIEDAALNDSINEVITDWRKILHYNAAPTTLLYGVTAKQLAEGMLQLEAGRMVPIPNENARVENLEMKSELTSSQELREQLIETYYSLSDSVRLDPNTTHVGQMSGFAIQLLYLPAISKTRRKRQTYGMMLSQMNRAILALNDMADPGFVRTVWPDMLPENTLEKAQEAQTLANFCSTEGALLQAGYTPEEVERLTEGMDDMVYMAPQLPFEETEEDQDAERDTIGGSNGSAVNV
jgi:hypothetical protein